MGVISAIVEKEFGERNFGFDSLKSRLNSTMEEKGIVARDYLPPEPRSRFPGILWAGKAEKREVTWPLMKTYGARFLIGASELSFYQRRAEYLVLFLQVTSFLATGGP